MSVVGISIQHYAGHRHLSGFRDQYTGFVQVYPMAKRSDVLQTYLKFKADHGTPKTLRTDGEYTKKELEKTLQTDNTRHEFTAYTSQQNADIESVWRVVLQNTRLNLKQANFPKNLWNLAAKYAAMQLKCWPRKVKKSKDEYTYLIPFETFKGYAPRTELMHPFGCTVIVHKRKGERKDPKLSTRGTEGIFLGISAKRKAFKVLLPRKT